LKQTLKAGAGYLPQGVQDMVYTLAASAAPNAFYGVFARHSTQRLLRYLDVDCVVDVGANEGQYAQFLRQKVGYRGRIVSCEPLPQMAEILRAKAARDPLWEVVEGAVSDRDGTARFTLTHDSQMSSLMAANAPTGQAFDALIQPKEILEVTTQSLATLTAMLGARFAVERPFLKLDTQGHDLQILRAGQAVLGRYVGISSELAVRPLYQEAPHMAEVMDFLRQAGFDLSLLLPFNAQHFPQMYEVDGLFVRHDLAHLAP
jgi:FkbM family methyltransferase